MHTRRSRKRPAVARPNRPPGLSVDPMPATYLFHGDVVQLLRRRWRGPQPIVLALTRRSSIKAQVEAFGLPHT